MTRTNRNAGFTLVEILIASLCMTVLGAGIYSLIRTSYDSQYMLVNQNAANTNARSTVDTLADNLRGMTILTAAAASDITYTNSAGASVRYWRNSADSTLRTTVNGQPSGGTQLLNGVSSLSFNYYPYNGTGWLAATSSPVTLSQVGAVDITVTGNFSGYARQVFSSVKLRQIRFNNSSGF